MKNNFIVFFLIYACMNSFGNSFYVPDIVQAAKENNINGIKKIINSNVSLNEKDQEFGKNALMWAAWDDNYEIAKFLIESGADINEIDNHGYTALLWAIKKGSTSVTRLLLQNKILMGNDIKCSPLFIACWARQKEIINILHEYGVSMNIKYEKGVTVLMLSSSFGFNDIVETLVNNGANINYENNNGENALFYAIRNGHISIINYLLSKDMDIQHKNKFGQNLLISLLIEKDNTLYWIKEFMAENHVANNILNKRNAVYGTKTSGEFFYTNNDYFINTVKFLIDKKIDINNVDNFGNTPLIYAAINGDFKVAKLLIENGASLNIENKKNKTALIYAVDNASYELEQMLLKNNIDINKFDISGNNAIMYAIKNQDKDIVQDLIKHKIELNYKNCDGFSPLYQSIVQNDFDFARMLLENGANPNVSDLDKTTPLMYASYKGYKDIVELLISHKAKINLINSEGQTAKMLASNKEIIYILDNENKKLKVK